MIQNSTQTQTAKFNYPSSPGNRTAKVRSINAETKHRIYDRLLDLLSNRQIKAKETGKTLPFILHSKTKDVLQSEHGFSIDKIRASENQIIKDAEYFRDYEVTKDAPAALYHALQRIGETNLIFENRIAPLPGYVLNALANNELEKEFGRKILLRCDGFTEVRAIDETGIVHKAVRLDISGWIIRNGFMMPTFRGALINNLKIFRHPKDPKPFILRTRREPFSLEVRK